MSLWFRIKNALSSDRLNSEIDLELNSHIDEAIASGRDAQEVRRQFGSSLRHRENSRDAKLLPWLDSLRADSVFAYRQLTKTKITTAAAVLSLALALGSSICAFTLVDALLFKPLPISTPDRLYALSRLTTNEHGEPDNYDSQPYPLYQQMSAAVATQADLIGLSYSGHVDVTYKSNLEMEKAQVQSVTSNMFSVFGLQPVLGRFLTASDDDHPGSSPYAVISYSYWSRRFGKDPAIVGKTFRLNDTLYQIVGVSGKNFTGAEPGVSVDIFVPITMAGEGSLRCTDCGWFMVLAQLRPGVAVDPIREKLSAAFNTFQEQCVKELSALPQIFQNMRPEKLLVAAAPAGSSSLQKDYARPLAALCVLVGLVLLIACANVANLMSGQAAAREREMALRVSLGAGRRRLIQLVLIQSAWLAVLSATLGLLFALWSVPHVISIMSTSDNPGYFRVSLDIRIILFSFAMAAAVTFLFGLLPALRASFVKPAAALKGGENPHSRRRLMYALIVVQVSFCFLVLFVAGLFLSTFKNLSHISTGFSSDRLLALDTVASSPQSPIYWQQVVDHLRTTPGVASASLASWPLLSGYQHNNFISVHGQPATTDLAYFMAVSPGWLASMQIPLFDGRDFNSTDIDPGTVIITKAFAQLYFPNEDPLGQFIEKTEPHGQPHRYQIVGLVGDVRYQDLRRPLLPVFFLPMQSLNDAGAIKSFSNATIMVRTAGANPLALASILRQEVPRARSEFRVSNLVNQRMFQDSQTTRERLLATLAAFFAAVALLLAGIGLYGVLHYSVLQRRREIGIRMAVGAQPTSIFRLVSAQIFLAVFSGAVAGLIFGFISTRYIGTLFYQVKSTDPGILIFPTLTILIAATIASLPAILNAIRTDPVIILRTD